MLIFVARKCLHNNELRRYFEHLPAVLRNSARVYWDGRFLVAWFSYLGDRCLSLLITQAVAYGTEYCKCFLCIGSVIWPSCQGSKTVIICGCSVCSQVGCILAYFLVTTGQIVFSLLILSHLATGDSLLVAWWGFRLSALLAIHNLHCPLGIEVCGNCVVLMSV